MALWKETNSGVRNGVLSFHTLLEEAVALLEGPFAPIFQQEFSLAEEEIREIQKERQERNAEKKKKKK